MTSAETKATAVAALPAAVVVLCYLLDLAGGAFRPTLILIAGVVSAVTMWRLLAPGQTRVRQDEAIAAAVACALAGWLLWLAAPTLLPLSSGPDLTHHLILIRYIEEHWRLVHDPGVERFLGEMAQYTPGSHLLAALAGAWSGSDGLRALHPILSASVALQAAFLWLTACRLMPSRAPRPLALLAVVLLFAAPHYFLGGFIEFGFVAQVVAGLFATMMWWAAVAWDDRPDWRACVVFALAGAAAFLTWPVYVGSPLLAFALVIALQTNLPWRTRLRHFAIAVGPCALVAGSYLVGRLGWLRMAETGGLAASPSIDAYGWPLIALAAIGVVVGARQRRGRATVLFVIATIAEAAAFYVLARRAGAPQPYMALKMFYLLLWPMTALAAAAVAEAWPHRAPPRLQPVLPWAAVLVAAALTIGPLALSPKRLHPLPPAVSLPLYDAGRWARTHLPTACIEYLVGDDETAYWLHLAVLGNPRMSARTGDNATYEPTDAILRWLTPGGLPYAIADLPALPRSVRDELDIVQSFGTAAVVRRRGAASCGGTG